MDHNHDNLLIFGTKNQIHHFDIFEKKFEFLDTQFVIF